MALILPPRVRSIVEPAVAPLIVTNAVALDFKHEAVWLHALTKHWVSKEIREWRREAVLCLTPSDFLLLRDWLGAFDYHPVAPDAVKAMAARAH